MATFGRFEAVREIHRTGYTTVYTGRSPESPEERFAIKVFQPPALLLEGGQAKTEIDLFLKSAEAQQKAAAGGAQYWAPVHQLGSSPGEAFYVTDKYEHSLQQLIDIRLKLSSKVLSDIVESVAKGLMELKESCRRPHGNLKATNVLISGTEDISQRKIVICDPLPDELIDAEIHWDSDLRAIAELIYRLVVHQELPRVGGWQAPDSKEWRSLGKNAASWRNLCNRLLNAAAKPGTITIETVLEDLAQLKTAEPFLSPRRIIAAAIVVVICAVALVIFWPRGAPATIEEWKQLCGEYQAWVGDLYEQELSLDRKMGNSRAERWREDTHLKMVLKSIKEAGYPYEFAKDEGMEFKYIVDTPGDGDDTKKGLAAIEDIRSFFNPDSNSPWPLLSEMHEAASRFEERGWEKPAEYLLKLVILVRPEPNKPIAEKVDEILELSEKDIINRIELPLGQIAQYQATVKSLNDPILGKFDEQYLNREIASIASGENGDVLFRLQNKIEEIANLGLTLSGFIEDEWKKEVDQQTFFDDHKNDTAETVIKQTLVERLAVMREYRYLRPDPREEVFKLVSDIESYIEQAKVSNPGEADECDKDLGEFRSNIETIKKIKGIEKNRTDIEKKIDDYKPKLVKLKDRALRAIETAKEYWDRIKKVSTIARLEEINTKWSIIRDGLLEKCPLSDITNNLDLYSELRHKIDDVNAALVKLDEELQRELPFSIDMSLKEAGWNTRVEETYGLQRKQAISRILQELALREDIPDVDGQEFMQSKQAEFTAFKQLRNDLTGIITAFNAIEDALDACYLLDEPIPEKMQDIPTIRTLWTEWKDNEILKQPAFTEVFTSPVARITELESLDEETDRQVLIDQSLAPAARREVKFAAWIRLGSLSAPSWPNDNEDVKKDRDVRDILKTEFEAIKSADEMRGDSLLTVLIRNGLEREAAIIQKNSSQDKVLVRFVNLVVTEVRRSNLSMLQQFEVLAKMLVDFVSHPKWPQEFRIDLLADDQVQLYNKSTFTAEDFEYWLRVVTLYKKLEQDPRTKYSWNAKIAEITKLIEDELGTGQDGSSKQDPAKPERKTLIGKITEITRPIENVFRRKQAGPSKQKLAKLEQEYSSFAVTVGDVNNLLALPAIEKNKDKIDADTCNELWNTLQAREVAIRAIIKPEYCKYLEIVEGKIQHLVFASTTDLHENFEPVNISRLESVAKEENAIGAITEFVRGSAESILSLSRLTKILDMPLSKLGELLNKTVEVVGWDQIRQAVNDKQTGWLNFFHTLDLNSAKNVGWPKYIVSKKDPSVLFRFIPAGLGNPEPFYMATHEITNAQYKLFLEEDAASGTRTATKWKFLGQNNDELVSAGRYEHQSRACKIEWDGTSFSVTQGSDDVPVTWVTFDGARSYAQWLGAQLPTAPQHKYACRAGTNSIRLWGNDLSQIAAYAHVRGGNWKDAVEEYNSKLSNVLARKSPPPVGVVKPEGFISQQTPVDVSKSIHENSIYSSAWPIASAVKPNNWGLYDMIGNVWEWCTNDESNTQFVVCGGSCLVPPEYIFLDDPSNYILELNDTDCDVGFRIIVPAE